MSLDNFLDKYKNFIEQKERVIMKVPTGSVILDKYIEGGIPLGFFVEFCGPQSSAKTTLAINCCKMALRSNPEAKTLYLNSEGTTVLNNLKNFGFTDDELSRFICISIEGSKEFEKTETLILDALASADTNELPLIVIDSLASVLPQKILESADQEMGLMSRLMTKFLGKVSVQLSTKNTTVIIINQLRQRIASIYDKAKLDYFNRDDEYSPGGKALQYYILLKLKLKATNLLTADLKEHSLKDADKIKPKFGEINFIIIKNKFGAPFIKNKFYIDLGGGINNLLTLIDLGIDNGIIEGKGKGWFKLPFVSNQFHGKSDLYNFLYADNEAAEKLYTILKESNIL